MRRPLVSILIPLYNSEKYIAETIQSCLEQTYKNIEVIIVDDGSTDNSFQIAQSYESDKVKVYKQENSGACRARNYAFELSAGDYIQYLDADDLLSPNKIEDQIKLFELYGNSIIANCSWARFYKSIEDACHRKQLIDHDYENPIDWLIESWRGKGMGQTSIWLIPREIIKKTGVWDESLSKNQDGEFFCRVLLKVKKIKFCENALVYYRKGVAASITSSENEDKQESVLHSYNLYEKYGLSIENSYRMRKALATVYSSFIYVYCHNKKLCSDAYKRIQNLGMKPQLCGGKTFRRVAKILGFRFAIKIKSYLKI
jgi:glycosyltransferase involved in cell wall biosynthesis